MGNPSKNIYVLMMSLIFLMGCLGGTMTSGSETTSETPDNHPPIVDGMLLDAEPEYDSSTGDLTQIEVTAYHAMTDWDGTISEAGWDIDLDGEIDYSVSTSSGISTLTIPANSLTIYGDNLVIFSIVFGAVDDDGEWGSTEILTSPDEIETSISTSNNFKAEDASAAISDGTDDTLIKIRWLNASDALNWAFVTVKLQVGDNVFDCSVQTGEECSITQDGSDDGVWETNEFLQLSEAGTEICGLAGVSCTINIYVMYDGSTVVGTQTVTVS